MIVKKFIFFCSKKKLPPPDNYRTSRATHEITPCRPSHIYDTMRLHRDTNSRPFSTATLSYPQTPYDDSLENNGQGVENGVDDHTYF